MSAHLPAESELAASAASGQITPETFALMKAAVEAQCEETESWRRRYEDKDSEFADFIQKVHEQSDSPDWQYPGQVIRDIGILRVQRDDLRKQRTQLASERDQYAAELAAARADNSTLAKKEAEHKQAVIDAMSVSNDLCANREAALSWLLKQISPETRAQWPDRIKVIEGIVERGRERVAEEEAAP